jgi:hypothetical protein
MLDTGRGHTVSAVFSRDTKGAFGTVPDLL